MESYNGKTINTFYIEHTKEIKAKAFRNDL